MHEFVEWQVLTEDWANALNKARIKEAVMADRMTSFLKGNGCLPTMEELKEVEALWAAHLEKRNALTQFMTKIVKEFTVS